MTPIWKPAPVADFCFLVSYLSIDECISHQYLDKVAVEIKSKQGDEPLRVTRLPLSYWQETFGSTCHGAGRAQSRNKSRVTLDYQDVLGSLKTKGVAIRVASPKLVMEEAPESYKDVSEVGKARKCSKLLEYIPHVVSFCFFLLGR